MYGLKAIILHDSYYRGLRTRIPCEGHTNNTGGNAAGKTSALTLIPVFYGKEPDSLINRSGDKSRFVDYYLPSKQSMVIFEYSRQTGNCCVVMYRKKDKSFAYRFIEGSADETLFHKNMESLYDTGLDAVELIRYKLPEQGVKVSKQINQIIDYRSIIQNDTRRLKGRSSFRQETFDFCLGHATSHMKHIEALTSVVLKQDQLLKQFRIMIVDSFLSEQISIGSLPYNRKDMALIQDLKSLEAFISHKEKVNTAITDYQALNTLWASLKGSRQFIDQHIRDWIQETQQHKRSLKKLESDFEKKEETQRKKHSELSLKIEEHSAKLQQNNKNLEDLTTEQQKWDDLSIIMKMEELENLQQYLETRNLEKTHYSKLSTAVKTHKDAHQAAKLSEENTTQNQIKLEVERKTQKIDTFHQQEIAYQKSLSKLNESQNNAVNIYKTDQEKKLGELNSKLIDAKVKMKTAKQPTQKEQNHLEQLDQDRKEKNSALLQAKKYQKLCFDTHEQSKEKRQREEASYKKQKRHCETLRIEQEKLSQQLFPDDNTLLAFLRTSELEWHDNIGKVIQPDLLLRSDLSPHLSDNLLNPDNPKDFYGVSLTLEGIESCSEAQSEEVLRQKLTNLEITIKNAEEDLNKQEQSLKKLNQMVVDNDKALSIAIYKKSESEKFLAQIDSYIEVTKEKIKTEGKKRAEEASGTLQNINKTIEQFNLETKESIANIEQQYEKQRIQKKEDWIGSKEIHNESIRRIEQRIQAMEESLISRIQELESQYLQLLRNEGIDTETLTTAKKRYEDATSKVEEIEANKIAVEEYKRWKRTVLSRKPEWIKATADLNNRIDQFEKKRTHNNNEHESQTKQFKRTKEEIKKLLLDIQNQSDQATMIIESITTTLQSAPIELETDVSTLPNSSVLLFKQANSLLKNERKLKSNIITVVREIIQILKNGHSESQIYQLWQQLQAEHTQHSRHSEFSPEFDLESIPDIQFLNEQGLSQIQTGLIQNVSAIGSRIARYHETLEILNRKVKGISRTLEKDINMDHQFTAISEIKVNMVSKVDEFDLWKELQYFKQHWEQWHEEDSDSLPNADFIKAFTTVLDEMSHSKIDNNLYSLVDLNISLRENNRLVLIRNDSDLKNASSTGVSLLAIIVIFCGMTRYLCKDSSIRIHWPLDEIGSLSSENTSLLFALMDTHNISLFCAQPNPSSALSQYFMHKNELHRDKGVRQYKPRIKSDKINPLLDHDKRGVATEKGAIP